jgi:hypothetical protein
MSKLIKPSEYAKQSGISRQAVYAKIKKGLLRSKKVDGQIFIELDSSVNIRTKSEAPTNGFVHKDLLAAKDETIKILKETINDLKATNNLIVGTLKGEVDLLKEAFGEMQQLYRTQISHLKINEPAKIEKKDHIDIVDEKNYIEVNELAKSLNLDKKERKRFKKAAKELQESGDFRFIEIEDDIYALKSASYDDFLEALRSLK